MDRAWDGRSRIVKKNSKLSLEQYFLLESRKYRVESFSSVALFGVM